MEGRRCEGVDELEEGGTRSRLLLLSYEHRGDEQVGMFCRGFLRRGFCFRTLSLLKAEAMVVSSLVYFEVSLGVEGRGVVKRGVVKRGTVDLIT